MERRGLDIYVNNILVRRGAPWPRPEPPPTVAPEPIRDPGDPPALEGLLGALRLAGRLEVRHGSGGDELVGRAGLGRA